MMGNLSRPKKIDLNLKFKNMVSLMFYGLKLVNYFACREFVYGR